MSTAILDSRPGHDPTDELQDSPYPGQESYQPEDAGFFYGRDREAAYLIARILSARMTVLHAASGAGKTSLLNACIVPGIEAKSWTPIVTRLNENPLESIRLATLKYVFPPLDAELIAVTRAMEGLKKGSEATLGDLLAAFDEKDERERRALIMPVVSEPVQTAGALPLPSFGKVTPYFCRLLRRSLDLGRFAAHLMAMGNGRVHVSIDDATPLAEILRVLGHPRLHYGYAELLSELDVPLPGLRPFFENLVETYGSRVPNFGVVLILDQFEELFTLFVDPGDTEGQTDPADARDPRLRQQLLKELELLYCASPLQAEANDVWDLPIRFVISLRDDYVAHLDPVRLFAPEINETSYRLGLLRAHDAREAVAQPARHFGYAFSDTLVAEVVAALASDEGRLVEPSRLQIVCNKLWTTRHGHEGPADPANEVSSFPSVKAWVTHVLQSFFREALERIAKANVAAPSARGSTPEDKQQNARMELLDILAMLITPQRTRNIVEKRTILHAPFRDGDWRSDLLIGLAKSRIVRGERRLRGTFYEVAHEFLIAGINSAIAEEAKRNEGFALIRVALDALTGIERGGSFQLGHAAFHAIDLNRDRLKLPPWAAAAMVMSAVIHQDAGRATEWARQYGAAPVPMGNDLWRHATAGERLLTLDELRWLFAARDSLRDRERYGAAVERFARSAILAALFEDRDLVHHWTHELSHVEA